VIKNEMPSTLLSLSNQRVWQFSNQALFGIAIGATVLEGSTVGNKGYQAIVEGFSTPSFEKHAIAKKSMLDR